MLIFDLIEAIIWRIKKESHKAGVKTRIKLFRFILSKLDKNSRELRLHLLYSLMRTTNKYNKERKDFYKNKRNDGRIFENGYDRYAKDYFLEMEIKPIIQNNRLKVNDEDYMGATAWSIWKDGLRITEVFCSKDFSKTENLYFYITDNFK